MSAIYLNGTKYGGVPDSAYNALSERVSTLEGEQAQDVLKLASLESGQAVLTSAVRGKQDALIPGTGIDITENVISVTGGSGSSSVYDLFIGEVLKDISSLQNSVIVKIGEDENNYYYVIEDYQSTHNVSYGQRNRYDVYVATPSEVTQTSIIIPLGIKGRCRITSSTSSWNEIPGIVGMMYGEAISLSYGSAITASNIICGVYFDLTDSTATTGATLYNLSLFWLVAVPKS